MSTDPKPHYAPASQGWGHADAGEEKLRALVRLGGGMAHDFNNILHVIETATDLLRRRLGEVDDETAALLDMLKRNAERGAGLTRELLGFAGRHAMRPVVLNANRLIADMQDRLRQALGRGPQIETTLGGSLWPVHADAAELELAVLNLAKNARDAMDARGTVTIETANVEAEEAAARGIAPGEYVALTVRDNGVGMTAETLACAFDPYFTTKDAGPMSGLGLSRVYGFVRQSGGQVRLESAPGAGTAVTLYLPRHTPGAAAPPPVAERKVVALAASRRRELGGLRVLVVEDESLIGMLAEDLLEQLGCRMVGLVSSLGRALDMAKSAQLDFALLDVNIGGEPVYPVALALQARGVPFLFMSGYGGLEGPWRERPIIQKPFDLIQLKNEIERALHNA